MQSYAAGYPYYGQPAYPSQPQYIPAGHPYGYPAAYYQQPPTRSQTQYEPRDTRDHPVVPPPSMNNAATSLKESHRKTHSTPEPSSHFPLKSSIKKTLTGGSSKGHGLTRQSTYPTQIQQSRPTQYLSQPTSTSGPLIDPEFRPLHMFMLFVGNNELRLENIMRPAMDELRKSVLPTWPGGIESDSLSGYDWTVKFRNNPWLLQGPDIKIALGIVLHLFTLFARRGFSFQASMNTGNPPPRLVFEVTSADITSIFFLAYFSQGGRRLTLFKPPTVVDETLGPQLKAVLPRKVNEEVIDDLRTFEVKKRSGALNGYGEVEPSFFLMHILKIMSELGYSLIATVPLGKRGPLGVKGAREVLIFKGAMDPMSPSPP